MLPWCYRIIKKHLDICGLLGAPARAHKKSNQRLGWLLTYQ
ncbi:hypothetical protein LC2W_2699 [Lacticaseibacillus paracasei]|nr:hypothetical protein LC2W_2699 [Lacticaseibacillus paracasei]